MMVSTKHFSTLTNYNGLPGTFMDKKLLPFLSIMFASTLAWSAISTTTFNVTAIITAACNIAASNLVFGTYDPMLSSNLDATTTLSVTCTNGSTYQVGLNAGSGTGATVANRLMTRSGDTNTIAYTLYQDTARTTLWGNTGTNMVSGTGSGNTQSLNVYGRIFATNPTTTPPGAYSDTITATITY
jgi:spore coat protein U-like protein